LLRDSADECHKQGKPDEARDIYLKAAKVILRDGFEFPLPIREGLRNEVYVNLDAWERIDVMACCNGLARCMIDLKNSAQASLLPTIL
jgi:hypothetical protein